MKQLWPYPSVLAHRGGGHLAPENTLAGMRTAARLGYQGVEFDAMLAADGVPVVVHDPQLGRTIAGTGQISNYTSAQLAQMDAGSWFSAQFAGEPVPTLQQVMQCCLEHKLWMNVEIKPAPGTDQQCGQVVAQAVDAFVEQYQPYFQSHSAPLLSSFSITALQAAAQAAPAIKRALLLSKWRDDFAEVCQQLNASGLHVKHTLLDTARIQQIHAAGLGAFAYTLNEPNRAQELQQMGLDAFCTDALARFSTTPTDETG